MAKTNQINVKLVRSLIGVPKNHRLSVKALGVKKIGDVRLLKDDSCIRGLINKVGYLLEVEEVVA